MPRRARPSALLIGLDGVLRRYDPAVTAAIETRYGLAPGDVRSVAGEWARLEPVLVGLVAYADWRLGIADALADRVGGADAARTLVAEYDAHRGEVVPEVLTFVREARRAGIDVVLATNATDALDRDLDTLDLDGDFDAVANSSVLRTYKPQKDFFLAACALIDTPPARCLLIDDTDRNVRGARAAGLSALRFSGPADLSYARAALSLPS
jgi:putative hydrolase of the HAD superfamily